MCSSTPHTDSPSSPADVYKLSNDNIPHPPIPVVGFIHRVIIITGLIKLYDCMFSSRRWPQMPTGRKTPTQTQNLKPHPPRRNGGQSDSILVSKGGSGGGGEVVSKAGAGGVCVCVCGQQGRNRGERVIQDQIRFRSSREGLKKKCVSLYI